ncbi:MAG: MlaE family ABC transporter permease [Planctomycetota bacterium]|jgi:phospholipid/cholesterol/gamma-HCH transport system permease protein
MADAERRNLIEFLGAAMLGGVRYAGGMTLLFGSAARTTFLGLFTPKVRFSLPALSSQMVRLGVKSLAIVVLVQIFIGVILALQMTPPLADYGQESQISSIIGVAGFRMLGPIITAVVLSGFAGASIAAELGTMVVAEEIEAMSAMAVSPIRFLVVPRILATVIATVLLSVIADMMIALGGYITAKLVLGPEVYAQYWDLMRDILEYKDFYTGLIMAGVFGVLISLIACFEGLKVTGGAEGVGRATTMTVVYSIVAIVVAACIFTVIFYVFGI